MGRRIYCYINDEFKFVYKYAFGEQQSEMYRIKTELGLGLYYSEEGECACSDILLLDREDIEQLNLEIKKQESIHANNNYFMNMLIAFRDFMINHPKMERFIFEGEL